MMAGRHEDILSNEDYLRDNTVIMKLLEAAIVDDVDPIMLFTGDATSILYAHRITGFGSEMKAKTTCPVCRKVDSIKVNLNEDFFIHNLDIKPIEPYNNEFKLEYKYDGSEKDYHNTYKFRFRFLRFKDAQDMRETSEKKTDLGLKQSGRFYDIMKRILISIEDDKTKIEEFINYAPVDFVHGVYQKIQDLTPRIDDRIIHKCSRCGTENVVFAVADPNFFWPKEL
jgi:hypothetical protein